MHDATRRAIVDAIREHPAVVAAAITGSYARRDADGHSDLDVLIVASDVEAVVDVLAWLPPPAEVRIAALHLARYLSVLLDDGHKLDLAIYRPDEPPSLWIVHDHAVIKGDATFAARLADAASATRVTRAAHLSADVSIDNVILLLATAAQRVARGELASAHAFLAMACDMLLALETRQQGVDAAADLLDPRRRLERRHPDRAAWLHACLFGPPAAGIAVFAAHLAAAHRVELGHRGLADLVEDFAVAGEG